MKDITSTITKPLAVLGENGKGSVFWESVLQPQQKMNTILRLLRRTGQSKFPPYLCRELPDASWTAHCISANKQNQKRENVKII